MDQSSIILYAIIILVLIGIPVILARKTGKKPMELLLGKRENRKRTPKKQRPGSKNRQTATGTTFWICFQS